MARRAARPFRGSHSRTVPSSPPEASSSPPGANARLVTSPSWPRSVFGGPRLPTRHSSIVPPPSPDASTAPSGSNTRSFTGSWCIAVVEPDARRRTVARRLPEHDRSAPVAGGHAAAVGADRGRPRLAERRRRGAERQRRRLERRQPVALGVPALHHLRLQLVRGSDDAVAADRHVLSQRERPEKRGQRHLGSEGRGRNTVAGRDDEAAPIRARCDLLDAVRLDLVGGHVPWLGGVEVAHLQRAPDRDDRENAISSEHRAGQPVAAEVQVGPEPCPDAGIPQRDRVVGRCDRKDRAAGHECERDDLAALPPKRRAERSATRHVPERDAPVRLTEGEQRAAGSNASVVGRPPPARSARGCEPGEPRQTNAPVLAATAPPLEPSARGADVTDSGGRARPLEELRLAARLAEVPHDQPLLRGGDEQRLTAPTNARATTVRRGAAERARPADAPARSRRQSVTPP